MSHTLRRSVIATAVATLKSGINLGTSGNLSVRAGTGMLITPSGVPYGDLAPDDIVEVDDQGQALGGTPSSEWRIHLGLYNADSGTGAVLHAHPPHATALSCLGRGIPAFHYEVALAGGVDIRLADYATFGTRELADNVLDAIDGRFACLIANHGMVVKASDPQAALQLALKVEQLAMVYCQCLQIGEPTLLDDAEMERVVEKFEARSGR